MKMIEEYNVNGSYSDSPIKGKLRAYTHNITKSLKGVKTFVITSWVNTKDYINLIIHNKELTKKLATGIIAGTILMTSLTGCQILPNAAVVQQEKDFLVTIDYVVKPEDNLWNIAKSYSTDINTEVNNICILNNIEAKDVLLPGTELKLEVKYNEPAFADEIKELEWNAKENFIVTTYNDPERTISPANEQFKTENLMANQNISYARSSREELAEMKNQKDLYTDDNINDKVVEIDGYYDSSIERIGNFLNVHFNTKEAINDYHFAMQVEAANIKKR